MKVLHWFNPENDLALAAGLANYTPPKAGSMVHAAGEALPLWYADRGDALFSRDVDVRWIDGMCTAFDIGVSLCRESDLSSCHYALRPWGWSAFTKNYFEKIGVPEYLLPEDAAIDKMRQLSHRRTAAVVAEKLRSRLQGIRLAEPAVECFTRTDALRAISEYGSQAYIKQPWSSSGRGVVYTGPLATDKAIRLIDDSIRRQGSIMVERAYAKALDFACLFGCEGGDCTFLGTSVFSTDRNGTYTGNVLAPETERMAHVTRYAPEPTIRLVIAALRDILTEIVAPHYTGILGVDMLVDADGTLNAAVEINMRCTMGYVANRFAEQYLHPPARGVFGMRRIDGKEAAAPCVIDSNRLVSGALVLSPPCEGMAFVVSAGPLT